jgi:tetratricopeptide (TPR) repeat protein
VSTEAFLPPAGAPASGRTRTAQYLLAGLLALFLALLVLRSAEPPAAPTRPALPIYIPQIEILRPALLGFSDLAADLTWLRTVQYFGSRVERQENFPQLFQLVDTTTSLDPYFLDAYVYGGLFLVIARQYPQAIAIYRKGIAHLPDAWQLPHDLGRLYFLELRDYPQALHWWQIADRLPGRPHYLPRFIARLQARTGHLDTALEIWRAMLYASRDDVTRQFVSREIAKLERQIQETHPRPRP